MPVEFFECSIVRDCLDVEFGIYIRAAVGRREQGGTGAEWVTVATHRGGRVIVIVPKCGAKVRCEEVCKLAGAGNRNAHRVADEVGRYMRKVEAQTPHSSGQGSLYMAQRAVKFA